VDPRAPGRLGQARAAQAVADDRRPAAHPGLRLAGRARAAALGSPDRRELLDVARARTAGSELGVWPRVADKLPTQSWGCVRGRGGPARPDVVLSRAAARAAGRQPAVLHLRPA